LGSWGVGKLGSWEVGKLGRGLSNGLSRFWIPACAGMTKERNWKRKRLNRQDAKEEIKRVSCQDAKKDKEKKVGRWEGKNELSKR
jgi:hypothetical protein